MHWHEVLVPDRYALGIYGRSAQFEGIVQRVRDAITELGEPGPCESLHFPPVVSRRTVERCGYLHSFPHLLGSVHTFLGDDRAHARMIEALDSGEDWSTHQTLSDAVLTPAACYALYPHLAGTLPESGRCVDVESWCYRHEPTDTPERMRAFRMREHVRVGEPLQVRAWRDEWIPRAESLLRSIGLQPYVLVANDPFFGTGARFMATSQREQQLKFELQVDIEPFGRTAVMSCNYHEQHFGEAFGIQLPNGRAAHSACVGFGLDRLALAILTAQS
jgi:seryl-tRNA synthetase